MTSLTVRRQKMMSTNLKWGWFWFAVYVFALTFVPLVFGRYALIMLTDYLVLSLFAASFNFLMGFGGMVSFGQATFYAIGAYSSALLLVKGGLSMATAFIAGPIIAMTVAFLFGFFAVRLTSVYFSMLTLAFAQITYTMINKLYDFTGGDTGIQGVDPAEILNTPERYYIFTLTIVTLACGALYKVIKSPFGLSLRAVKENRKRAEFVGMNYRRVQHVAFVIGGFLSGLAGSLYAFNVNSVDPSWGSFAKSFEPLLATLIGGVGSIAGPFVGSFIFKILETTATLKWPTHWPLVMGSILIFVTLFWWSGFIGMLQDPRWQKWLWVPFMYAVRLMHDLRWYIRERKVKWKQRQS